MLTVEASLQEILQKICQCEIQIRASSRTDSGVHACGQVATVEVPCHIRLEKLFRSLNALLPDDVSIPKAVEVKDGFSARRDNLGKRYIYRVYNAPAACALNYRFFHWVRSPLNLQHMREAALQFLGSHDFAAFRGKGCQQLNTCKIIKKVDIDDQVENGITLIQIVVEGNSFLKNMVRIMAGTLIDIGRGRLDSGSVSRAIKSGRRDEAGFTAPAKGLTLDCVFFSPDPFQ